MCIFAMLLILCDVVRPQK